MNLYDMKYWASSELFQLGTTSTGKIYLIKVKCVWVKILTFKDEVLRILMLWKIFLSLWKKRIKNEIDSRAAQRAKHVFHQCCSYWDCLNFISTFWTLPRDQTAEGLLSLQPQRKGGRQCAVVRRLSANPRKKAVESQRRRVDTSQQLPNKLPYKRLCFIYKYMMERWVNIPQLLSSARPISVHGA